MGMALRAQGRHDALGDEPCRLRDGEVHVWFASLIVPSEALETCRASLSHEECARAARFRHPHDRDTFIAAHGIARKLLGGYVRMAPHELRFRRDRAGKPVLDSACGGESLQFNMSHSRDAALYGVAFGRSIGVDIELMDPDLIDENVSKEILSRTERSALDSLPPAARLETLFRYWTIKEAYLKARGDGLSFPLSMLDVSAVPAGSPKMLPGGDPAGDETPWTLACVPAYPGYAAAAACTGSMCRIVYRQFRGFASHSIEACSLS